MHRHNVYIDKLSGELFKWLISGRITFFEYEKATALLEELLIEEQRLSGKVTNE